MRKHQPTIVDLLRVDSRRVWATSYTVDEWLAYGLLWLIAGNTDSDNAVTLSFHRSGFRRAGSGQMPRPWLKPFDVPGAERSVYHPKLVLIETASEKDAFTVSTANLADDDFKRSRNLIVKLDLSKSLSHKIRDWIKGRPLQHRALCLLAKNGSCINILPAPENLSTLQQINQCFVRCKKCSRTGVISDQWIVASPIWSPGTVRELLNKSSNAKLEAYFRTSEVWKQIGGTFHKDKMLLARIDAFELRDGNDPARWHHKVVGWRCCNRPGFQSALYLGSANATTFGLGAAEGSAKNWEAGVIWLGTKDLWDRARNVARIGYKARKLARPTEPSSAKDTDEIVPDDIDDLKRHCSTYGAKCLRINRASRSVTRTSKAYKKFRISGKDWQVHRLEIYAESSSNYKRLARLTAGKRSVLVPAEARATAMISFVAHPISKNSISTVLVDIDLFELDPPLPKRHETLDSSITAVLTALSDGTWGPTGGLGTLRARTRHPSIPDIRFPFRQLFAALNNENRRYVGERLLERIAHGDDQKFDKLPHFWRRIAQGTIKSTGVTGR